MQCKFNSPGEAGLSCPRARNRRCEKLARMNNPPASRTKCSNTSPAFFSLDRIQNACTACRRVRNLRLSTSAKCPVRAAQLLYTRLLKISRLNSFHLFFLRGIQGYISGRAFAVFIGKFTVASFYGGGGGARFPALSYGAFLLQRL